VTDYIANRDLVIDTLRRELFGPSPAGHEIDVTNGIILDDYASLNHPYREAGTGEEILTRDAPIKRYGVGVLFPVGEALDEEDARGDEDGMETPALTADAAGEPVSPELDAPRLGNERDDDDLDLSLANAYQQSSLGISFLVDLSEGTRLVIEASGGRYRRVPLKVGPSDGKQWVRDAWVRSPVSMRAEFDADELVRDRPRRVSVASSGAGVHPLLHGSNNLDGLDLRVEVFARPREDRKCLATVCLVNRTPAPTRGLPHAECLFQTRLSATVSSSDDGPRILPYPVSLSQGDAEQEGLALLYREAQTFATGHGCAADWEVAPGAERAREVSAACLPVVETPGTTPDITREDGSRLSVSMAALAGLTPDDDGRAALREVVERYEEWIDSLALSVGLATDGETRLGPDEIVTRCDAWARGERALAADAALGQPYRKAAVANVRQCAVSAGRMRAGIAYLEADETARRAFRLANHAVLLQQIVTRDAPREVTYDPGAKRLVVEGTYQEPDPLCPGGRGTWRPFQVAFLLASLRSTVAGADPDHELVELIWFPTGGGKTEAYLGLAAFAMFKRRLDDKADAGVHVLMRYTLRLLTAQQFQRASGLICAMERLRTTRAHEMGATPFSIGIWVGGGTTPNWREGALDALRKIEQSRYAGNPFLLSRCPWCGAGFGRVEIPVKGGGKGGKAPARTPGLHRSQPEGQTDKTVAFVCPDEQCPFSDGLPIYVIDEDIYAHRPTLVIGTIDKFAVLAWRPQARALFGLGADGQRDASPPGLVIQDELHLIAGPLGSLAGLYETVIEELCTDHRGARPIPPKIVGSTATIRHYQEQIRDLYARPRAALFPPPGIDAGDSFFARYDRERPGRVYVGVHAASLGSVQTEWVRALASLLQAPATLDDAERDPWWTLLIFFNSIREMGTAHTLIQSDIPDYARVIWEREDVPPERRRYLRVVDELTGGLGSDEITRKMGALETTTTDKRRMPVDVCLASSIIEVGIDISRLSLMVVAGQPKTTSQYIQVTGRVGRQRDKPGLVVTLYSPSKPRDRSHFERFRGYHERLYAHVEPTSVTPFSPPALDRALHAVMVAYARQQGGKDLAERPYPFPETVVDAFRELVLDRVREVDPTETEHLRRVLEGRIAEWRKWKPTKWEKAVEDIPLLRRAGAYASTEVKALSWATLSSMRNVDAECEADITTLYATEEVDTEGVDRDA